MRLPLQTCFELRRGQTRLNEYPLFEPVDIPLSSNKQFVELKAMKHAGATLSDYEKYYGGKIDQNFLDFISLFYLADGLYNTHVNDVLEVERHNREQIAKAKAQAKKTKTR